MPIIERKIAFYDIDKTSYEGLLIKDFVKFQVSTGTLRKETSDDINEEERLNKAKKIDYETMAQNMLDHWALGLKDKSISDVEAETERFFTTPEGNKFFPFVRESINMIGQTHDSYFITAEPQFIAKEVTKIHKATGFVSTIFGISSDGKFTGKISSSLVKKEKKGDTVRELLKSHIKEQSFAIGDSDGDILMLEGVEYPICVNASDELKNLANQRGWKESIKKPEEVVIFIGKILNKT